MLRYVCVQFEGVVLCVSFFVRETSHKVQPIPMNIPRARVRACAAKMCRMCVCVCVLSDCAGVYVRAWPAWCVCIRAGNVLA